MSAALKETSAMRVTTLGAADDFVASVLSLVARERAR